MSKHTPGPWKKVGNDIIESADGFQICRIISVRGQNADLIAAAPEMLKAIREVWRGHTDECLCLCCDIVRKLEGK